ncbi:MAG: L,D-transpeptidase family protein, partial [Opitutaceae bacterium]|nr:L,D-transpeptidase family protein [Opitutaceae bacterium]
MTLKSRRAFCISLIATPLVIVLAVWQWPRGDAIADAVTARVSRPASVRQRLRQYGDAVRSRMEPLFKTAGVAYPAARLAFVGLKEEKRLELWAANPEGPMRLVKTYPIKAASGGPGPKLREGDRQVPEGIYAIESLNPNSRYHLSLRVNYPNAFDRARAKEENRANLGGDIMVHGKAVSIGCLAMGDEAIEELFVLAALTGAKNIEVLLCPRDLRARACSPPGNAPAWTALVYQNLQTALVPYTV